ncbi:MAG: Asp-tRNA(Asn)/Glu-tRNA(Gln) amidotransferase GatCAB subunit B, partial [Chloroflexi bacterium]|nr:Asp-tRNA(Asn)/Glu-tRNA(Gln) amidotransferase GatCAB subunit B [Chloroflexota bacterium]
EYAEDYRYFPEPDLPPLELSREWVEAIRRRLPELPAAKRARFTAEMGIKMEDAEILAADRAVAEYFEAAVRAANDALAPQTVANWMVVEVLRLAREVEGGIEAIRVRPNDLVALIKMVGEGVITQTVGKEVLAEMFATGAKAEEIVERRGLRQISDAEALRQMVQEVLAQNPGPLQQYLEGKQTVFAFFVGQIMRATRGKANPHVVSALLREELEKRGGSAAPTP